jgi:hypothetical protein
MTQAYPLHWPPGWPRTKSRNRQDSKYRFGRPRREGYGQTFWTLAEARDALLEELGRIRARGIVVSTNYTLRNDGLLRASQRTPDDTGVAGLPNLER